jgi:hypothetical protein
MFGRTEFGPNHLMAKGFEESLIHLSYLFHWMFDEFCIPCRILVEPFDLVSTNIRLHSYYFFIEAKVVLR